MQARQFFPKAHRLCACCSLEWNDMDEIVGDPVLGRLEAEIGDPSVIYTGTTGKCDLRIWQCRQYLNGFYMCLSAYGSWLTSDRT